MHVANDSSTSVKGVARSSLVPDPFRTGAYRLYIISAALIISNCAKRVWQRWTRYISTASLATQTLFLTRAEGALKRVWSNGQYRLVNTMPRKSRRVNHVLLTLPFVVLRSYILVPCRQYKNNVEGSDTISNHVHMRSNQFSKLKSPLESTNQLLKTQISFPNAKSVFKTQNHL